MSARSSAKIRCASARMWAASASAGRGGDEVEVGGDAADPDGVAEEPAEGLLEDRPPPLRDVLEERLLLGEAEGDDVALDADRAAVDDQRLARRG